ncbi:amino acid transporter-like protein [Amylocarpus encephaloides]|uniref:Amino acid transporter-like protein n=1 Tax=Amylocarpus encephaloides TaxID=45428 RepID=A0A9P7YGR9_9HELO|nr:amino acid transporter-like protein [Amylocarpus encephaloides]
MTRSKSQGTLSISAAISTVASPLRNSFADINCRSPVTPRRPWAPSRNEASSGPNGLSINTERAFSIATLRKQNANTTLESSPAQRDDDFSSSTTLVSPTSLNFLPHTPHFNPSVSSGKLGTFSAINIILGKTLGVGIYSIPSSIFNSIGSVGASLTLWVLGSLISFCGLAVYLDFGCALPRSGGERIYLERIFRKPYMLATCMFMSYVVLLGFSTPNCIVLGEYLMYAFEIETNRWNVRLVAVVVITLLCYVHARYPRVGLRLINILGVGKMVILVIVILSGVAGIYMGVGSSSSPLPNFSNVFAGSSTQPHDYSTALLKILYCFRGYSTANQVLSSVRNPVPTLKRAAPIALLIVSSAYIFANIAYFAVVSREDFRSSGVLIAGHFFRNVFGEQIGGNILPLFIIISAFGNIAATSFAQARVNMELGRDGLLPFSSFFQSKSRHEKREEEEKNVTAGLFLHWLVSVLVIILPPPGEIYNFLVDIGGYPVSVISVAISLGLLYLQTSPSENWKGHQGYEAKKIYTIIFAASNILLLVLPWIKPTSDGEDGKGGGERFMWFAYPSTSLGILGLGVVYWIWWSKIKPLTRNREVPRLFGRRHKRSSSGEVVPILELQDEDDEDGARDDQEVGKRAPCGCPRSCVD